MPWLTRVKYRAGPDWNPDRAGSRGSSAEPVNPRERNREAVDDDTVVVDDATAARTLRRGSLRPIRTLGGRPSRCHRQCDHELAAVAGTVARCLDAAPVQLHELPRQGEADAEPALPLRQRHVELREHLEDRPELVGRNPEPVVGDAHDGVSIRRKDEFLATLGHELRNPLAPIANALEIMRMAANDEAVQRRAHELIERQLAHMVRLIVCS